MQYLCWDITLRDTSNANIILLATIYDLQTERRIEIGQITSTWYLVKC